MIGTILNVGGILLGGLIGLSRRKPLLPAQEGYFKVALFAFTVFYGLRLTWLSINGSLGQVLKQLAILLLALTLGRLLGRLLRLQQWSNRLGQHARQRLAVVQPGRPGLPTEGFKICAALFCAAPLGLLGAIQDGLSTPPYFYPLAVKAVIDGLATMGFVALFRWGPLAAALPVLACQGTLTLLCAQGLKPFLEGHSLVDPINAVGGVLVFSVGLIMLDLKRVQVADYLPSLAVAPVLAWFWR